MLKPFCEKALTSMLDPALLSRQLRVSWFSTRFLFRLHKAVPAGSHVLRVDHVASHGPGSANASSRSVLSQYSVSFEAPRQLQVPILDASLDGLLASKLFETSSLLRAITHGGMFPFGSGRASGNGSAHNASERICFSQGCRPAGGSLRVPCPCQVQLWPLTSKRTRSQLIARSRPAFGSSVLFLRAPRTSKAPRDCNKNKEKGNG